MGGKTIPKLFKSTNGELKCQPQGTTQWIKFISRQEIKEFELVSSFYSRHTQVNKGHYIQLSLDHQECVTLLLITNGVPIPGIWKDVDSEP